MVNNILDGAHLKEGRLTFQFREVELRPLLEEVVRLFNPLAKDAGKILSSDWPQLPARLRADEEKLFRILLNLLANAFKFTRRGDRVTLGARPAEKGGVAFWVQDTGWGIPPEKIGGLLTSEKGGGAGMGLRIVQALVEGHGGKMEVRSVSQQGTTVEFLLPEGQP
jgi:signal transduction histidine kinase